MNLMEKKTRFGGFFHASISIEGPLYGPVKLVSEQATHVTLGYLLNAADFVSLDNGKVSRHRNFLLYTFAT